MVSSIKAINESLNVLVERLDASRKRSTELFDVADRLRETVISAIEQHLQSSKGPDAQMIARYGDTVEGEHPQWVIDSLKVLRECETALWATRDE